jgi:hypothetical protein
MHKDIGKCNVEELALLLYNLSPEVIFIEALENTYTDYQKRNYEEFGLAHSQLEISAIQMYSKLKEFQYVPILENGISEIFDKKFKIVCNVPEFNILFNNFQNLAKLNGFEFLNSKHCIELQEELRLLESKILIGNEIEIEFNNQINTYEDSMIFNISKFCENSHFSNAVFMCGVAHRKSMIQKITNIKQRKINWKVYGIDTKIN